MIGLMIGCTSLLAVGVMIVHGISCGHDFNFHLLSWMEVARAWQSGLVSPHWVLDANFGAGEPRLIFYPPASWLLGALLGTFTSWPAAPILFVFVALLAGGASMYRLAREWAPPETATLAACLYAANPYALFVAYERAAFGELLASAWLPLLVLFALRKRGAIAPLGIAVAALWLTNSPAAVVASYLLAMLALAMSIATRQAWPALRAAGGMTLGLGLAAFYIVPAAFEQRWVQIQRAIIPGMRIEDSFLFAHTADAFHDQVLRTASWIVVAELAIASLAASLAWRKQTAPAPRVALTATLPLVFLLQLPLSSPLWKYAPHLKFLQFPWRWLMALSVVACVLTAMAMERTRRSAILGGALIALMAIGGGLLWVAPCDEEDAVPAQVAAFRAGVGTPGSDEYTPVGADNAAVQKHLPLVRVLRDAQDDTADSTPADNPEWRSGNPGGIPATVDAKRNHGEHWKIWVATPQAGFAVLRLMEYPSWQVTVDGVDIPQRPAREDGLMAVPLNAGVHTIDVHWIATADVLAGRAISAMALVALAGVALWERQRPRSGPV